MLFHVFVLDGLLGLAKADSEKLYFTGGIIVTHLIDAIEDVEGASMARWTTYSAGLLKVMGRKMKDL